MERDLMYVWSVIKSMFKGIFGSVFGGNVESVFRCNQTHLSICLRATGRKFRPTEKIFCNVYHWHSGQTGIPN